MDLTSWLPALFLLGLVTMGLMFAFVAACIAIGGLIGLIVGRRIFQNGDISSTKPILALD